MRYKFRIFTLFELKVRWYVLAHKTLISHQYSTIDFRIKNMQTIAIHC